ncbi:unnamed protein product [Cuscuta campestris]|uniref:FAD-binding FR-type domain-containing protein n=1 Tax=Cuscuta campestris TaxID=132261 RepID=A0A484LIY0_9ASTE|nr:unnamed protein product [Cuscuta campestris]
MAMGEEKKKSSLSSYYVRGAILGLAFVVFLGNMMMWAIMPTFTYYLKWLPHILAHTQSTFFGIQGPIMLNFTFPILFIAVIGCFYIHLGKGATKPNINLQRNDWLKALRKPNIIKPLGIVTWTELFFAAMFVVLCVWYFAAYVHYHYTSISVYAAAKAVPMWQAKIDRVALVAGLTGNICLTFLFYPVTRRSSILPMLGLTSEGSIKYHIWLGHAAMILFTAHGVLYILFWAVSHRLHEMVKWDPHYISNVAGEISLVMGLIMWATTYTPIRRKMFELFFYTHYLYIGFILFFTLHTGFFYACIMLPGFYLFLVDRYLRFLQSRQNVCLLSARLLPCQTFELNFSKTPGLKYNPTSIMFINVPTMSKLQWHPFTITSNCNMEEDTMSAIVKCEGSWTKKLFDLMSSPSPLDSLQVSVEGPYGPAQTDFLRHDVLVMISGGSGITPFISIIKEVIISSSQNQKTPKLVLIAIFKSSSHLSTLDLLLPLSTTTPPTIPNHLDIQIEAYITRETKPTTPQKPKPVRTVRFKPRASDTPISPVLGPHGWLWLAAIISASFLVYLLLVGVLYQYYVYPMDHGTNLVFPYHTRALLNLLFMCFGIGVSASAAFLWNKKKMAMEANKKILETGDSSSLGSGHDDHQELESFPAQSLNKMINTHYCTRPDLKRIITEIKGSSVGVLASGPKTLRHDVAAICSSGLLNNVTFESNSFNW